MAYEGKKFNVPSLEGISDESVKQHIGLYEGYVKNFNALSALMPELSKEEKHLPALHEVMRRRSFEFGGMRLHEHYFPQLEGGAKPLSASSALAKHLEKEYHGVGNFESYFRAVASIRGPGWAMLYWDPDGQQLLAGFTGEQHQGHFVTLPIVLALDVWEHAYILDHGAAGRSKYVDAFFKNLNWAVAEARFEKLSSGKPAP